MKLATASLWRCSAGDRAGRIERTADALIIGPHGARILRIRPAACCAGRTHGPYGPRHRRGAARGRQHRARPARCRCQRGAALPQLRRRRRAAGGGAEPAASGLGGHCRVRPAAGARSARSGVRGGARVRRARHPGQQRLDLLSDPGRRHHRDRLGRPGRHQPAGAAVSFPGCRPAAACARRAHRQSRRHPRRRGRCGATRSTASPRPD